MAVAGLVRLRKHQFGRQASFGTPVTAKRAYGFKGVPSVNLNWTDPDIDVGSLDPVSAPYRGTNDLTAPLTGILCYNDLPLLHAGFFGGAETGTGTPDVVWDYAPASVTVDDPDVFTYEFGDDVTDDWYQLSDGILESVEFSAPAGLGPLTTSQSWRFGVMASSGSTDFPDSPTVPTAALSVETNPAWVYLKDGEIAICSDPADFATSQVSDALHAFTMRWSGDLDQKRYANGTQSFDVQAYARATRMIELELVLAKTSDTVGTGSESDAWMSEQAVDRFVQITFTSLVEADTATPYSWVFSMPLRYYTREETDEGGNTTITLTGHAFYDPNGSPTDFDGVFKSTFTNTLATASL